MVAKLTEGVKEGSLRAPIRHLALCFPLDPDTSMVLPHWFTLASLAPETAHRRKRGELLLDGESIILEFLGPSQVAVVKSYHNGRKFVPGGVIWVKKVAPDGITLLDVQYFGEGALGALRAFVLIEGVEGAKVRALEGVAKQLPNNLVTYLNKGSGGELPWALTSHLALLGRFSETPKGDFAFADRQIRRMYSIFDRNGRENRGCRVMGIESTTERIIKMSKLRQQTAGAAAIAVAHLDETLKSYEAFINYVMVFIDTKLDAKTWDINNKRHWKWLRNFLERLSAWAEEFKKMDMQPFTADAARVSKLLGEAESGIGLGVSRMDKREIERAKEKLETVVDVLKSMLLRFETARALRVVSLAADERMQKFGIKVTKPNWIEIEAIAQRAMEMWKMDDPDVIDDIAAHDPERAYEAFRKIVEVYDDASWNAS